jgi:hypothetical protein
MYGSRNHPALSYGANLLLAIWFLEICLDPGLFYLLLS